MNLRYKILSGFIILALMLAIAGLWSIYYFQFIGIRVDKMIDIEYKSINNSISMLHALEREDSAILLALLGNFDESSSILHTADSTFAEGFNKAQSATFNADNENLVLEIEENYKIFKNEWQHLNDLGNPKNMLEWYWTSTHIKFMNVKKSVEKLLLISENELYATASNLKDLANRAAMPGIIALISALAFTIMFSYFVNLYFISPITKIITAIKKYKKTGATIDVKVRSKGEMADLANGVKYLRSQIKNSSKK